jgi:glycosyltransferase involved in cell wall biosynthesis
VKVADISFYVASEYELSNLHTKHTTDALVYEKSELSVTFYKLASMIPPQELRAAGSIYFLASQGFFSMPWKMLWDLRQQEYSVIVVHGFIFPVQVLALRVLAGVKTKIVVRHHAEQPYTNRIKRALQRLAYRRADAFTFVSRAQAQPFIDAGIVKGEKVHEIMEGSTTFTQGDKLYARTRLGIGEGRIFLWVGRLDRNKDPLTALQAFAKLPGTWHLYMIFSAGDLQVQVRDFIGANSLQDRVRMIGEVPHDEIETWYRAADYFILGSHYEGSGYALCEAMACGCIPVVTRIPSFVKMTDYGNAGILYEPGDYSELLSKLEGLDKVYADQMRAAVITQFSKNLSFTAIGDQLSGLIQSLSK